jgi:hypothetical protein
MSEQFQHRASAVGALSAVVCAAVLAFTAHLAQAADPVVMRNFNQAAAAGDYWTPARMMSARPMDLPSVAGQGRAIGALAAPEGSQTSSDAHAPIGQGKGTVTLHDSVSLESLAGGDVGPAAANPSGQRFTNARVVPMNVLRGQYPWQTVGKLFFVGAGGGNFVCSGAIAQRRVIATAGHCVYDAALRRFHSNFLFVPGFDNGASPCGGYGWSLASVTGSWAGGGGVVPNAADFGVLVAANRACRGQNRPGASLGWLGWRTSSLLNNHVTILGYPCNLDSCQILQRTDAQVTRARSPNSAEAGSYHEGGASGGPWVQDWGNNAAGQPANTLQIVGITSYGPTNPALNYLGSSILNAEWVQIWNIACGQPGACS